MMCSCYDSPKWRNPSSSAHHSREPFVNNSGTQTILLTVLTEDEIELYLELVWVLTRRKKTDLELESFLSNWFRLIAYAAVIYSVSLFSLHWSPRHLEYQMLVWPSKFSWHLSSPIPAAGGKGQKTFSSGEKFVVCAFPTGWRDTVLTVVISCIFILLQRLFEIRLMDSTTVLLSERKNLAH